MKDLNSFLGRDERELNSWHNMVIEVQGDDNLSCGRGDVVRRIKIDVDDEAMRGIGDSIMSLMECERKWAEQTLNTIFNQ